jgi:hypothetical protein
MIEVCRRYAFKAVPEMRHGVTAPQDIEPGVLAVVSAWNETLPANHCRVLSGDRFREIQYCLEDLTAGQIIQAVRFYASQQWNRIRGAWQSFDHWFVAANVRVWFERAEDARDRAERTRPAPPAVRKLTSMIGRPADPQGDLRRQFDGLPADKKRWLWNQALVELGGGRNEGPPDREAIMRKVLDLLGAMAVPAAGRRAK